MKTLLKNSFRVSKLPNSKEGYETYFVTLEGLEYLLNNTLGQVISLSEIPGGVLKQIK